MNYRLLIVGLFFLCNPEITIIDLLPDWIGFLLIIKAITPLAPASPSAEEAAAGFRKLAWISAIKAMALLPMMSLYRTEKEITLLFTAGFAILTSIYLLPALSNLFASIAYFSERAGCQVVGTKTLSIFTFFIFLIRYLLAMIPESVYLFVDNFESISLNQPVYPLAPYRMGITLLSSAVSLVIGLIWFTVMFRYIKKLKNSHPLNAAITRLVSSVVHTRKQGILASAQPAIRCLSLSFLFFIGYSIEGLPIFPAFLTPLFITVAMMYLKRILSLTKRFTVLPLISTVMGGISYLVTFLFCERYYEKASVGFFLVKKHYSLPVILDCLSISLTTITVTLCVIPVLKIMINEHGSTFWETAYLSHNSAIAKEKHIQTLKIRLIPWLTLLCGMINMISFALFYVVPLLRIASAALGLCLFWFCKNLLSDILQSVKECYTE